MNAVQVGADETTSVGGPMRQSSKSTTVVPGGGGASSPQQVNPGANVPGAGAALANQTAQALGMAATDPITGLVVGAGVAAVGAASGNIGVAKLGLTIAGPGAAKVGNKMATGWNGSPVMPTKSAPITGAPDGSRVPAVVRSIAENTLDPFADGGGGGLNTGTTTGQKPPGLWARFVAWLLWRPKPGGGPTTLTGTPAAPQGREGVIPSPKPPNTVAAPQTIKDPAASSPAGERIELFPPLGPTLGPASIGGTLGASASTPAAIRKPLPEQVSIDDLMPAPRPPPPPSSPSLPVKSGPSILGAPTPVAPVASAASNVRVSVAGAQPAPTKVPVDPADTLGLSLEAWNQIKDSPDLVARRKLVFQGGNEF